MSGLCGWFSHEPGALPIGQMGAALLAGRQPPPRLGAHGAGAVALVAGAGSGSILHEDGLLVAVWGQPAETLARLWRSHGPKACAALSGSFAFAILDERRDEALVAVDRSGARPMFYQQVGHTLVFASSVDALVLHPGTGCEIDPQALYNYLYLHAVPAQAAIFKGHKRLLPGEYLHFQGGRLQRARYWKLQFHEAGAGTGSAPELAGEFLDTLRAAALASLGDQAGGLLLSGGQGSAAVAAMLADAAAPLRTYAVGYDAGNGADHTLARAREQARQLNATHREWRIGAAEAAEAIPMLARGFDQPIGDPAVLAAFHGAQMAGADGVQRLLGGHGCAELFGARSHYVRQARLSQYESIPSALRQTLVEPLLFRLAGGAGAAPLRRARTYIEQALVALPGRLKADNLLHGYGSGAVFEPDFLAGVDAGAPAALLAESWWQVDGCSQVNGLIALDLQYALADQQLPAMTGACALAGLEAAYPFLGDALMAFAARLAPKQKLDGVRASPFLSQVLREALRASVPRGACGPFAPALAPFGHWLQADAGLRELAFDSLADLKRRAIVRADFIDTLLASRLAEQPAWHGRMVWLLMMLEQWLAQRRPAALHARFARSPAIEAQACRQ
ncbi:MAG: asparagine synthase family protein [Massilia sp.]|nr:asparagine synthase family protein [Massilia sp.]